MSEQRQQQRPDRRRRWRGAQNKRRGGGGGPRPQGRDENYDESSSFPSNGTGMGGAPSDTPFQPLAAAAAPAQQHPTSQEEVPLDNTARFADLAASNLVHPQLIKTITDDLKFEFMTPVQASTIHELLPPQRNDVLAQAKTGTGKTIAFLVPALQTLLTNGLASRGGAEPPAVSTLVISPTRELAMQIAQEATNLLQRFPQYKVQIAIGGTNKNVEEKRILSGCHVLIATPGRLLDHMANPDVLYTMRRVDTLVLDEADRLLDMGFMKDLRDIVNNLPDKKQTNRQGMLFSATIAGHVNQAAKLVLSPEHKFISLIPAGEANVHERVPQLLVTVDTFSNVAPAMVSCIREEIKQHADFKAILFAPTAALAGLYGYLLGLLPDMPPVSTLSSRISQNRRTKITNDYRDARNAILVATDVVARGMDFPGVTNVFQVGIPADKESYIHRIGRTARAGAGGRAIFIVSEAESWFPRWNLKDISFVPHPADLSPAGEVASIAEKMDETERAKVYQAWLGYYKNHLKGFKWDNVALVAQGNEYARHGLRCPETPGIPKSTVGKMGLRGTKGLVAIPDPPKARHGNPRGGRGGGGRGGGRA